MKSLNIKHDRKQDFLESITNDVIDLHKVLFYKKSTYYVDCASVREISLHIVLKNNFQNFVVFMKEYKPEHPFI